MTFSLRVPADGWANDEPHSHDSLIDSNISDVGSSGIPFPREFDIVPSSGTIAPQGEMEIKVLNTSSASSNLVAIGSFLLFWLFL